MLLKALVCYGLAFAVPAVAFIVLFRLSRGRTKLYPLHIALGVVSFLLCLAGVMAVILLAFSEDATMYMTAYVPEWLYKFTIAFLIFGALCLVRHFALNFAYFSRSKEKQGNSFLVGFGMGGGIAVAVYSLFFFVYIAFTALSADFVELTDQSLLLFEDSTVISVFTPFEIHVSLSLFFVVYTCLMLVQGRFMTKHANYPFKWSRTLLIYCLITLLEFLLIALLLFFTESISLVAVPVAAVLIVVPSALCVRYLYNYKEEVPYESQF